MESLSPSRLSSSSGNRSSFPATIQWACHSTRNIRFPICSCKVKSAVSTRASYEELDQQTRFGERQKALDAVIADINSSFGKGSVTRLGSAGGALVETFPSGCITLDLALGGGLPKGRIIEVFGPESSGKTTLALHAIAQVQRSGGNAVLVDAEHAFDPYYSKNVGVDVENLIVCQPDNGEMALESGLSSVSNSLLYISHFDVESMQSIGGPSKSLDCHLLGMWTCISYLYLPRGFFWCVMFCLFENKCTCLNLGLRLTGGFSPAADRLCRSGAVDLICIDSVSALTPRAEIEGEIGMQQIGLQARLMSQALRKMAANAAKAGCTLLFINQIRYKVAVMYGNPEVTSGGLALKFFASLRLEIRSTGKLKSVKGDEDVGLRVRVKVVKSKVSRPYKQAEFDIIFGSGICRMGCILDCAEMKGVVQRRGSWYSYGDARLGQGRDRAVQYLRENTTICDTIEKAVRSRMSDDTNMKQEHENGSAVISEFTPSDLEGEEDEEDTN